MSSVRKSGTTFRLKMVVLFLFLAAIALFQLMPVRSSISAQTRETPTTTLQPRAARVPLDELVEGFDASIQKRFLTMPMFGRARLAPIRPMGPESTHLDSFSASTPEEYALVNAFNDGGWDVGIYLFGRRVQPRITTKKENDYDIRYRLFRPIAVTKDLNRSHFRDSKKFAEDIKNAFVEFQDPESPNYNQIKFEVGKWSYIARPVRAVNQSCLQCHKDPVISERLGEGKFVARPRRLGDPNGVVIYAFSKRPPRGDSTAQR